MTYTALSLAGVALVVLVDWFVTRSRMITRKVFWVSYAIIFAFQLLTNAALTGWRIVRYGDAAIIGSATPVDQPPAFIGDGRIAFAPVEDLGFGFALVLLTLSLWVMWGRLGVQRTPTAGPPRSIPGATRDLKAP